MDISNKYILMCERALEIQEMRIKSFNRGDYIVNPFDATRRNVTIISGYFNGSAIWLPRQDQLQEMVEWGKSRRLYFWNEGLSVSNTGNDFLYLLRGNSMEHLWLAFVMKEKFDKIWDDEEWKKH